MCNYIVTPTYTYTQEELGVTFSELATNDLLGLVASNYSLLPDDIN